MTPQQRIVGQTPMEHLWDSDGDMSASRGNDLGTFEIRDLLRRGNLQFVAAEVGTFLKWIPLEETLEFWRDEVRLHIAEPNAGGFVLEDYPNEYAYRASLWQSANDCPIVLLEVHH